mgnify:CR=1 FL=1
MAERTRAEVDDYLDGHGGYAVLSTIGKDGYPHAVPLGFFRSGEPPVRKATTWRFGRAACWLTAAFGSSIGSWGEAAARSTSRPCV